MRMICSCNSGFGRLTFGDPQGLTGLVTSTGNGGVADLMGVRNDVVAKRRL